MESISEPISLGDIIRALREANAALNQSDHHVLIATNQSLVGKLLARLNVVTLPAEVELNDSEVFAGGVIETDGRGYYVVLMPGEVHRLWAQAIDWAVERGGLIPNRVEIELLFKNCREHFQKDHYFTCEVHERNEAHVWIKSFASGSLSSINQFDWVLAKCIRRIPFKTAQV